MEEIGYLIAIIVVLGIFAIILWDLFISGLKFILFIIGLAIVVTAYEYIQANMEVIQANIEAIQNILDYTKFPLLIFSCLFFAYLWKRTNEKERIEELEEEDTEDEK